MWTCKMLSLPYEFKRVDAGKGEQKSPEFLKLNPNAVFPVLVEGDFVVYESNAICRYLCSKQSGNAVARDLYPENAQTRALVDQWLDWKHGSLREGCAGVVRRQVMAKMVGKGHSMFQTFDEVKPEREVRQLTFALQVLESQLGKTNAFIVQGTVKPTLADVAVFEEVEQLKLLPKGGNVDKDYPKIALWQEKVRTSLPSFTEVHKDLLGAAQKLEDMRNKPKL